MNIINRYSWRSNISIEWMTQAVGDRSTSNRWRKRSFKRECKHIEIASNHTANNRFTLIKIQIIGWVIIMWLLRNTWFCFRTRPSNSLGRVLEQHVFYFLEVLFIFSNSILIAGKKEYNKCWLRETFLRRKKLPATISGGTIVIQLYIKLY
jgi:hypothetical protein